MCTLCVIEFSIVWFMLWSASASVDCIQHRLAWNVIAQMFHNRKTSQPAQCWPESCPTEGQVNRVEKHGSNLVLYTAAIQRNVRHFSLITTNSEKRTFLCIAAVSSTRFEPCYCDPADLPDPLLGSHYICRAWLRPALHEPVGAFFCYQILVLWRRTLAIQVMMMQLTEADADHVVIGD